MKKRVQISVYGRVQGVWFRSWCQQLAVSLSLAGWVRNDSDGSLRIEIEGDSVSIDEFCDKCNDGPELAIVTDKFVEIVDTAGESDFKIIR